MENEQMFERTVKPVLDDKKDKTKPAMGSFIAYKHAYLFKFCYYKYSLEICLSLYSLVA